jgi:hypothetical protein
MATAATINPSASQPGPRKMLNINLPVSVRFSLKLLSNARHLNMTTLVLSTIREYTIGLRVLDSGRKGKGHEHTIAEQLDKVYLHLWPYSFPKYILKDGNKIRTKMRKICVYVPTPLLDEAKHAASSQCLVFNDFLVQILADRMERELDEDPTLLLCTADEINRCRKIERSMCRGYRTRDHFEFDGRYAKRRRPI